MATVEKDSFLKTLPYLCGQDYDRPFISNLIKDKHLTERQQEVLTEYFNVYNSHWRRWKGDSTFRIWVLFTDPEACEVFDKDLIEQARLDGIPEMTRRNVGSMKKNVAEYAKTHPVFSKLYYEKKTKEDEALAEYLREKELEKKMRRQSYIGDHRVNLLQDLYEVVIDDEFPGLLLEFTQEEYDILLRGHFSETMEDKWNVIPEENCLHFCRSWTGDEIYRVEILHEKCQHGDYKIKSFYVNRYCIDENVSKYIEYGIRDIIFILFCVMLKKDIRQIILEKYGKDQEGILRLWSNFGSLLFTEDDG